MLHAWAAVAAVTLVGAIGLAGCGKPHALREQRVLVDAGRVDLKQSFHVKVVPDPFGGADKVISGGPLGPEEPYANKATFTSKAGFFKMPASGKATLHLTVGVRKITAMKVEVWARDPKGGKKFTSTLPADGRWEEIAITLDPAVFKPGCVIEDVTVFQVGKDPKAELYVGSISVRTY